MGMHRDGFYHGVLTYSYVQYGSATFTITNWNQTDDQDARELMSSARQKVTIVCEMEN